MRWSIVCLLFVVACSDSTPPPPTVATRAQPIVNGARERGHPAVGALVRGDDRSFCTGTLVRRDRVLTAAHCFGGNPNPGNTFFYVGDRAGQDGPRFAAADIHIHPRWAAGVTIGIYDVAVIELAEAVLDVEPYTLFAGDMDALVGAPLFYVGFGANQGDPARGSGTKRSTSLELEALAPTMFVTRHDDTGVCFGDSGGPALLEQDGGWFVVGINSSVRGQPVCLSQSLQVRVDVFRPWIRAQLGDDIDCAADPVAQCGCEAGCVDGICDPLGCVPQTGCRRLINCLNGCRGASACQTTCYSSATPAARALYDETITCSAEQCGDAEDVNACVDQNCPTLEQCFDDLAPGDADCETVLRCNSACQGDERCRFECYAAGSDLGRTQYDGLLRCINRECGALANDRVAYQRCVTGEACRAAWHTCAPPDDCALTGGDCAEGETCRPESWTGAYCRPTAGTPLGEPCGGDGLQCEDGALCDARADGARCRSICLAVEDCEPGQRCTRIVNAAVQMGVCTGCVDRDLDGTCDAEDCAPEDETRGPQAREICDDGVDQDCDDAVDEGCAAPDPDAGVLDAMVPDADVPDAAMPDMQVEPDVDRGAPDAYVTDMAPVADVGAEPGEVIERQGSSGDCSARPGPASGAAWSLLLCLLVGARRRVG